MSRTMAALLGDNSDLDSIDCDLLEAVASESDGTAPLAIDCRSDSSSDAGLLATDVENAQASASDQMLDPASLLESHRDGAPSPDRNCETVARALNFRYPN